VIAGHFGLAAAVKAKEPTVPLWSLMLATSWLDVVFVPLFLSGVETLERAPDATGPYGAGIIHANYTHSLAGSIVLSLIFGGFFGWLWGRRAGIVLGLVAFSHWVLDLVVHRADLPLLPGNAGDIVFGFGVWRYPAVSSILELALVLAGSWLYWRAASGVAGGAHKGRAMLAAGLMLVFGLGTLLVDLTGFLA
jgi:hypothetical protein